MSVVEEGVVAILPPPPDPVPESLTVEPVPFARKLWDYVTLFGGLSRDELYNKLLIPAEAYREYARWHPEVKKPDRQEVEWEYFDRGLQHGLDRGWLMDDGRKITAGNPPPEHMPFTQIGSPAVLRSKLTGAEETKAFRLLTDNNGKGVRHVAFVRRNELKKSLKSVGQLYPILRWNTMAAGAVIVDGVTRLEILTKDLGLDESQIWFQDIPQDRTALEVLQMRIEAELTSTSKDQSDDARNVYIATLADAGFTQASIGKLVNLSQRRVGQLLSQIETGFYMGQPTEEDVAEFRELEAAGWNIRAIAERTGRSKSTVSRYLNGEIQPRAAAASKSGTGPQSVAVKRTRKRPGQLKEDDEALNEEIQRLVDADEVINRDELAERHGVSTATVQRRRQFWLGVRDERKRHEEEELQREHEAQQQAEPAEATEPTQEPPQPHCPTCTCFTQIGE